MLDPNRDFSIRNTPFPGWFAYPLIDAGWLYVLRHGDLLKVGKTTNPKRRLRDARTWLPEAELIGMKPFWDVHKLERTLLCGLAQYWLEGEWHHVPDAALAEFMMHGFGSFDDHDRNSNTLEFGYWIGGSGMGEIIAEQNAGRVSLRQFQREPF